MASGPFGFLQQQFHRARPVNYTRPFLFFSTIAESAVSSMR
jgi:hypothetical protein